MMIIVFAAALASAFLGVSSFILSASSQLTAETYHASPNYYYLTNPKMLTVGANNAYVLNDQEILVFNTTEDLETPIQSKLLDFNPAFIKYAQGIVFLFEEVSATNQGGGFTAISYSGGNFTNRTNSKISYTSANIGEIKYFDVCFIPVSSIYRVFFASETHYGWNDYKLATGSSMINPIPLASSRAPSLFSALKITAIACDGASYLYICIAEDNDSGEPPDNYIYQVSQATYVPLLVNLRYLSEFTSFAVIPNNNQFVYIDKSGRLTLFSRFSADLFSVPLDTDDSTFATDKSRKPIFTTVDEQKHVYVIDEEKRSVDRYILSENGLELMHEKVIAGYRGGDSGFFNRPTSITLIDTAKRSNIDTSSEYLITDRAGQIMYNTLDAEGYVTSKPFFANPSIRLADNSRATYDNYDTVYIYDYDSVHQRNRVRTFTLDGIYKNREFTGFGARVSFMFADSNRTVYVLDATKNSIYYYSPSTMSGSAQMSLLPAFETAKGSPQAPEYEITTSSQGAYNEQLDAIILSSIRNKTTGETETVILPLDGSAAQILNITNDSVISITLDALGNVVVLSLESDRYFLSLHKLQKNAVYETTQNWRDEIEGATVNVASPSLRLDAYNRRLLYIGARHAIEAIQLPESDISSPKDHIHNESWKDNTEALSIYTPTSGSAPIFVKASADIVIYKYPGAIHALAFAQKDSIFKVLSFEVSNYADCYVLYENSFTGEYITGYVSHKFCNATEPYSSLSFTEARVMFSHTQVLKYPTTDRRVFSESKSLALFTLEKNYESEPLDSYGLLLSKKVTTTDVRGFSFYEIRVRKNMNGTYSPDQNGMFVGYVNTNNVIDYWLNPSISKFLPNATIKILPSHNVSQVQIYERTGTGEFIELQNEFLKNTQPIRIVGQFQNYTYIYYDDPEVGSARYRDGWIETKYIVPNGLSAIQLIAIAALALVILAGITIIAVKIRKRSCKHFD